VKIDVMIGTNLFHCNARNRNTVNFGYYQSWSIYRYGHCNPVWPGDIQVEKFGYTHLAFSFAGISPGGKLEPYNGNSEFLPMFENFNALKSRFPELKTLIAVGGWSFEQSIFVAVASTDKKREYFANSVVEFLETYGFDGIDLDWE
jgi:chitinase